MIRLWFLLRRIRQRATPLPQERGALEVYLREQGVFEKKDPVTLLVQRIAMVACLVLIASAGVTSYAYASDEVLPNTPLYPVRQALEQVEVRLATTPVQKRKVVRKMVERRQKEVQKLKELKRSVPVPMKKYQRLEPRNIEGISDGVNRKYLRRMLRKTQNSTAPEGYIHVEPFSSLKKEEPKKEEAKFAPTRPKRRSIRKVHDTPRQRDEDE